MTAVRRWATPLLGVVNVALVVSGVLDLRQALVLVLVLELLLVASAAGTVLAGCRSYRQDRAAGTAAWPAFEAAVHAVLPRPLAAVLVAEATTVRSLWLALHRRDDGVGPHDRAFSYAGGTGLTMGALTAIAAVELVVVHLVVPWPRVRTALLVVGLWTLVVVLGTWAGLRRHPHVLTSRGLLLRAGPAVAAEVAWDQVAAVRRSALHDPPSVGVQARRLHLPVDGTTTLLVELREPVRVRLRLGRTAEVDSIACTADDPRALLAAVAARAAA